MTSCYKHSRGGWYVSVNLPSGRRTRIYLGKVTKKQASYVSRMIELLRVANHIGADPATEAEQWAASVDQAFADKLRELGIIRSKQVTAKTLAEWCDEYTDSRADYSPATIKGWKTARKHFEHFGSKTLEEITITDAKQFSRRLASTYSSEHASKIVERAKQLFVSAIESKLIAENPFTGLNIKSKPDSARKFYLTRQTAALVLKACPNQDARSVFVLARFAGLRIPHEPLALRWSDIDWARGRLSIPGGTKTGARTLPLFPEVRDELACIGQDDEYIFTRARSSSATTWREWLLTAIATAGLAGWPKLWVNLRASCRTDLEDRFPAHVCDAWLGHSSRVAKDHYLQVKPEHWELAAHGSAHGSEKTAHGCAHGSESA